MDYNNRDDKRGVNKDFFPVEPDKVTSLPENNVLTTKVITPSPESLEQHPELSSDNNTTHEDIPSVIPEELGVNKLGETIDADLPPDMQALPTNQDSPILQVDNPELIRTVGNRLNGPTLRKVNAAVDEFYKDNNPEKLNDIVRGTNEQPGLMGLNVHNSFGRTIGDEAA